MQIIRNYKSLTRRTLSLAGSILLAVSMLAPLHSVHALADNPTPKAQISFTFDDGLATTYNNAAPILTQYGLEGTDYVITGCVGMTKVPNTCRANTDAAYMTWAQVQALQNTLGWEIGSHTVTHPLLASKDASDGQPKVLTPAQITSELVNSRNALAAHGINATDFSTPYGDYNNAVLAQIAKYYASHRGFADVGYNSWPNNDYLLYDYPVQAGVSVAQVESRIDQAILNNQWLVLTMHDIKTKPSTNPDDFEYSTANLAKIAAYAKAKIDAGKLSSTTVNKGLVGSASNMLANGSFNDGMADGWTTDSATAIKADSATNGSYPDPTSSIAFSSSSAAEKHLFSPTVTVSPTSSYMFKAFLNLAKVTSGHVGFYVDEYDANGNWVSGQYKSAESNAFVEDMNFAYTPTSVNVSKVRLQVSIGGTGVSGYLDNVQMFATGSAPTNTNPNLVTNGTFDQGLTGGWSTDSTTITADNTGKGSPNNAANSVKLVAGSTNTHLFSPRVAVSSTHSYSLLNYVNVTALASGEVGFYVDEYDANGNWVSGQYKTGVRSVTTGDVGFSYTPTSSTVASASLQVIVVGNSGITAYFDDSRWYQAN